MVKIIAHLRQKLKGNWQSAVGVDFTAFLTFCRSELRSRHIPNGRDQELAPTGKGGNNCRLNGSGANQKRT